MDLDGRMELLQDLSAETSAFTAAAEWTFKSLRGDLGELVSHFPFPFPLATLLSFLLESSVGVESVQECAPWFALRQK